MTSQDRYRAIAARGDYRATLIESQRAAILAEFAARPRDVEHVELQTSPVDCRSWQTGSNTYAQPFTGWQAYHQEVRS